MYNPTNTYSWKYLEKYADELKETKTIQDFFDEELGRFEMMSIQEDGIFLDYSKNLINKQAIDLLIGMLREADFENYRSKLFNGDIINNTEHRAVLHTGLRSDKPSAEVSEVLNRIEEFSNKIRNGEFNGFSGEKITDVVNIGIGGSDLGPKLVIEALHHEQSPKAHFLSNIDSSQIHDLMSELNPETTLFIISSKSFTTQETLVNANTAREWVIKHFGGDKNCVDSHFIAVSSNVPKAIEFGINKDNIFPIWDWVGGRFSLWSAIGIVIPICFGMDIFKRLLAGANKMDNHFLNAPLDKNIPVIMALIGVWHRNFMNYETQALIPYDHRLRTMPTWLQQVDMESNGKSVNKSGKKLSYKTGPIIFGKTGTESQHYFFQLLHQGKDIAPVDFIVCEKSNNEIGEHHNIMLANVIAQAKALMVGRKNDKNPHKNFDGNRPSNTIILEELTPENLGGLLAAYEHKIFTQGIIWDVNSFDQFGVELGKVLASEVLELINSKDKFKVRDIIKESLK